MLILTFSSSLLPLSSLKFSFFSFWVLTISSMAAHIFQNNHEISKQEIQTALAKAVELRTLHATLLHGNSPASTRFPTSASPSIPCSSNLYSAQDYPVFMPVNMTLFSGIFCFFLILHGLHLVGFLFSFFFPFSHKPQMISKNVLHGFVVMRNLNPSLVVVLNSVIMCYLRNDFVHEFLLILHKRKRKGKNHVEVLKKNVI